MSPEDQDVFIVVLKSLERAIAQTWALQGMLDSAGVQGWRPMLEKIETGILPDIHAQLRPLSDAVVGLPPLGSQSISLPQWRENMQRLIDRLLEFQGKRQSD